MKKIDSSSFPLDFIEVRIFKKHSELYNNEGR